MDNDNVDMYDEIVFNTKSHHPLSNPSESPQQKKSNMSGDIVFTRRKRKLSKEKLAELEKEYQVVAVNDYGDEYHMSEEERKRKFKYYATFCRIAKCKRKYRHLDEYVKVYRLCMDTLKIVADDNGIYSPEKFTKMVLRNQIEVFGLHFPKYIGKDKKDINWELISEFIVDRSLDPKELSKEKESLYEDMDDDELEGLLFDDDEIAKIEESLDKEEDFSSKPYYGEESKQYDVVEVADKEDTKRLLKSSPELIKYLRSAIKEQRRHNMIGSRLNSFVYEINEDDYEKIERIDNRRGYYTDSDVPEFTGDIMNRKDYKKYLMMLDIYEKNNIKENYKGKMRTIEEINEIKLKDALEKDGWNVRNLYKQKSKEKKLKKAWKKDKKREEQLKERLMQIQNRQKKRKKSSDVEFNSKKDKKKKSKKKKDDG